ncbi:MAG: FkbM family methyltransferase [Candidatus Latescibacterota bacterium]
MDFFIRLLQRLKLYDTVKTVGAFFYRLTPHYEREQKAMLSFYGQFIHPGDVCFDIGANVGNRAEIFLKLGARVIALEPQSSCAEILDKKFGGTDRITVIREAAGESAGTAELMVSEATTISSLSPEWIARVRESGRFSAYSWEKREQVKMTTLDDLISRYGEPVFCKIDVEGFEYQVIRGLSQPVGALSFEFTPEYIEPVLNSIRYLSGLGEAQFNYSPGETMQLALAEWVTSDEIIHILKTLPDASIFGDVYVRFHKSEN